MPRVTSKHAPRRDDELAREEHALLHGSHDEGRTEPRRAEAPGDDEPSLGRRSDVPETEAGAEMRDKSALAASFEPSLFPARRDQLVAEAAARYADDVTLEALRHLPDAVYGSVDDVWDALVAEGAGEEGPGAGEVPRPGESG
jgi:hypothetical protein